MSPTPTVTAMQVMSSDSAHGWSMIGPPIRGRSCGACQLCCVLIPTDLADGHKDGGVKCKHQCSKGCRIYPRRPRACREWSCKWLFDETTSELRRPDRCGYVIDPMLDTVIHRGQPRSVIQVWCDPHRPDAHRDPALRQYLAAMAERHGMAALIRDGPRHGFVLAAPSISGTGEWIEVHGNQTTEDEMSQRLKRVGVAERFLPR